MPYQFDAHLKSQPPRGAQRGETAHRYHTQIPLAKCINLILWNRVKYLTNFWYNLKGFSFAFISHKLSRISKSTVCPTRGYSTHTLLNWSYITQSRPAPTAINIYIKKVVSSANQIKTQIKSKHTQHTLPVSPINSLQTNRSPLAFPTLLIQLINYFIDNCWNSAYYCNNFD